jgi:ABC-type bacteriocin/lantibiotic exporter with double-glycine peptidase domain
VSFKSILKRNIVIRTLLRLRWILPAQYKKKSAVVIALVLFNSLLELVGLGALIPLFVSILQPDAFESGMLHDVYVWTGLSNTIHFIMLLSAGVFVFTLVKNLLNIAIVHYQARFSFQLYGYFATRLQRYFYQKGLLFLKHKNSNEVVRDINSVPTIFANSLLLSLINLATEIVVLLLIVISILFYEPKILLMLAVLVFPVFLFFYQSVKNKISALAIEANELGATTYMNLYQSIFGYIDVMINNNKEWFFRQYQGNTIRLKRIRAAQYVYNVLPTKVIEITMILGILCIIAYGLFFLPSRGDLLVLLGVFGLAAYRTMPSINRMMVALMAIKSYQYTIDVIEQVNDLKPDQAKDLPLPFKHSIELKDLTYRYPGKKEDVLKSINLTIKKGESIGIVGRSGSGKTTLVNVMLGFLPPSGGQISIDKTKVTCDHLASLRGLVGYVQQEVFLIDGTLADNIAIGFEDPDLEKVMEVAKRASLEELIEELPNGIHTRIGERGTRLSGGQKQRVGIARALYSRAEILFFDEATSSLDSETEHEITEAIHNLEGDNLTMIIIAHRISTLKYCDRLFEVRKGKVVEVEIGNYV